MALLKRSPSILQAKEISDKACPAVGSFWLLLNWLIPKFLLSDAKEATKMNLRRGRDGNLSLLSLWLDCPKRFQRCLPVGE